MAPLPKPPGQRVRRNAGQGQWSKLPGGARREDRPELGLGDVVPATAAWWDEVWSSPMAAMYLDADVPGLRRLAALLDLTYRGDARADLMSEIRQLEDRFGLSPKARRSLQWEISAAGGEEEAPAAPQAARRDHSRFLRAVDGGKAS